MLNSLKNKKVVLILLLVLLMPIICYSFSEVVKFLLELGRLVGSNIHNLTTLC